MTNGLISSLLLQMACQTSPRYQTVTDGTVHYTYSFMMMMS